MVPGVRRAQNSSSPKGGYPFVFVTVVADITMMCPPARLDGFPMHGEQSGTAVGPEFSSELEPAAHSVGRGERWGNFLKYLPPRRLFSEPGIPPTTLYVSAGVTCFMQGGGVGEGVSTPPDCKM